MADTRISKIQVRQGNYSDLPVLDAGELGYSKDTRQLFIGNDTVSVGTGNGVITEFIVPISLGNPNLLTVYVAGTAEASANYSVSGTTLTFTSAPTGAITAKFNNELEIINNGAAPTALSLAAGGTTAATGFQVDTLSYNVVIMEYTLESAVGVRVGQIRMATDTSDSTAIITDNNTETAGIGITFGVDIATANTMKLIYTDSDNIISKFKYTYKLWNSN
jgi:hypothetical protein|tara:strand:+ start:912 stop:1571 length:660 start_codon:yes stop_codon:yes gene_type:complete